MAYPYICDACKEGRHDECEIDRGEVTGELCGGGFCVCKHYVTKNGRVLTEEDIQALADEAEKGYDIKNIKLR